MKTIYIYELIRSIKKFDLIKAIEQYAQDNDYEIRFVSNIHHINNATKDDILIIWNRHIKQDDIARIFEQKGALVVLFENPYIKSENAEYYSVAYGYHNDINYAVGVSEPSTERFNSLGKTIHPWKETGDYYLFATQAKSFNGEGIGYHKNRQPAGFDGAICHEFITHNTPLRFRTHPNNKSKYQGLGLNKLITISDAKRVTLEEDLAGAIATVVYTSNTATESLLAGVPVFYCGNNIFLQDACIHGIEHIKNPYYADNREELFARIAWSQYTLEEIANGMLFDIMLDNRP